MSSLADARFEALRAQLFTGATNDMVLQWLQANGAVSDCLPDAWLEMLDFYGHIANRSDGWYSLLGELGFTGAMNDRETSFWSGGGTFQYVSTMNGVDSFFGLTVPWVANGDYSIKYKINFTASTDIRTTGAVVSVNGRTRILGSGSINWRPETVSSDDLTAPGNSVNVLGTNEVEFVRIGALGNILVNGISVATGPVPTGVLSVDAFGRQSTNFGTGQFWDIELTDLVTPSNSLFFRLDNPVGIDTENSVINTGTVTYNNITVRTLIPT